MTGPRRTILAVAATLLVVVVLSFLAKIGLGGSDLVELRTSMWNIDDEAAIYVDCKNVLQASGAEKREARIEVAPDAVITVQVDNDLDVYAWGIRVDVDGHTILRSERGRAEYIGANRNDMARAFETVFNKSMRTDGTPTKAPRCVRV